MAKDGRSNNGGRRRGAGRPRTRRDRLGPAAIAYVEGLARELRADPTEMVFALPRDVWREAAEPTRQESIIV